MTRILTLAERAAITARIFKAARSEPYAYGVNDCFFMGLRQIDAIRGTAHEAGHAGAYTTLLGANRALRRKGHRTLVTYLAGFVQEIAWGSARIGDLAVIEIDRAEHVALHGGQGWLSITEGGPVSWPLAQAKQAFGV